MLDGGEEEQSEPHAITHPTTPPSLGPTAGGGGQPGGPSGQPVGQGQADLEQGSGWFQGEPQAIVETPTIITDGQRNACSQAEECSMH